MRAIPTLKISISGVRGVVGESLTPTLLARFSQAFGTYAGFGRIVVGRDTRTSGEMVRQAVVSGLLSTGCRIIDLGICPTPTVQLTVRQLAAQGGIAITASHNPPEWNALKFVGADGLFLDGNHARELLDIYHQGDYTKAAGSMMRPVELMPQAADEHVRKIVQMLGPLPASKRRLRVAIDAGNGAGSIHAPRLLEALGADVFGIYVTPDGRFPRPAEPLPENLGALCQAVRDYGADVGFAQDMDADRLAVVSELGEPIGEERTLLLATQFVLGRTPGPVVGNLATTYALEAVASRYGCKVHRSPIGEANVAKAMQRYQAVIGGEGNGGVIYPPINFARDSMVGMALILHLLAQTGRTVSQLVKELPAFFMIKKQIPFPSHRIGEMLSRLKREYAAYPTDVRDGVKVILPEGWFIVRGSNTEPVVRVVAEAPAEEVAARLSAALLDKIQSWQL
jgi:phosphomannomutase